MMPFLLTFLLGATVGGVLVGVTVWLLTLNRSDYQRGYLEGSRERRIGEEHA